ncbi:efflux RND transporter periplasmic adaptor subunit [Pseudomonas prosekii]|uniref:Putative peptide zinc metalloprotease protein n=1 Tax=Pseudomonas prosekii TaxID=1148509 RepID=A0A1H1VQT8_9PSED|nr:efflux RND transporter periplasmic adaptor subunit [Pseudomonas prosekii]SDS86781.1 putative peptide zinc metalloprotease protein [Pseudomonas prosekii]
MSLPSLRADLQLQAAAPALDGSPRWTLADPVRGRYFKLGAAAMRLLRHWSLGDPEQVLRAANREPGLPLDGAELEQLLNFLRGHDLISALDPQQRASYSLKTAAQRQTLWQILLHQYLFFRIPLWRPDVFLNRAWPWLQRFGPYALRIGLPATLALGVFLVSRDWQRFIGTFPHLFSLGGALAFGVALFFAKLCHEFGHAFMAKRAGCRVQSMGVAFMVMLPMFYTDVSDAWRVNDRRARLFIGAGGVFAELLLACLALLAWSLLPDGPARTAAFMLASATWITTLVINLNPFMRFDGYFLLSDFWEVDNLQGRAFALCRWRLREALFGYGAPAPEPWSPSMQRRLLIWGYGAWLWRAVLFFGIALAVYHLFFKVLGIFLMFVELIWFIFLPIVREWREWWTRRDQAHAPRVLLSALGLLAIVLLLAVPWRSAVELPSMLEAGRVSTLHAPVASRVKQVNVRDGQMVAQGEVLIELESPDLDSRQAIVRREIQIQQLQMRRQASRSETVADAGIVEQRLAEAVAEYRGLAAQRERLLIRAPQAGKVRDVLPQLNAGRWLSPKEPLARIVEPGARLRGYLAEAELWRIAPGADGRFIAEDPMHPAVAVQLSEIDANGARFIEQEALTSDHHGPIAVRRDQSQRPEPVQAQYAVRMTPLDNIAAPTQPLRGVVVMQGRSESLLGTAWRRLAALGVRESGF